MNQQAEKDKTERVTGLGRDSRHGGDIRHPRPPFGGQPSEQNLRKI